MTSRFSYREFGISGCEFEKSQCLHPDYAARSSSNPDAALGSLNVYIEVTRCERWDFGIRGLGGQGLDLSGSNGVEAGTRWEIERAGLWVCVGAKAD